MDDRMQEIKDRWNDIQDPDLPVPARQARERILAQEDVGFLIAECESLKKRVEEKSGKETL